MVAGPSAAHLDLDNRYHVDGAKCLEAGRRRSRLLRSLERLIAQKLEHRIAAFDAPAATASALLMAQRRRTGQTEICAMR